MKVSVADAKPFGSVDSCIEGEEEGVVELLVPERGGEQVGRGYAEVRGEDAAAGGTLCGSSGWRPSGGWGRTCAACC